MTNLICSAQVSVRKGLVHTLGRQPLEAETSPDTPCNAFTKSEKWHPVLGRVDRAMAELRLCGLGVYPGTGIMVQCIQSYIDHLLANVQRLKNRGSKLEIPPRNLKLHPISELVTRPAKITGIWLKILKIRIFIMTLPKLPVGECNPAVLAVPPHKQECFHLFVFLLGRLRFSMFKKYKWNKSFFNCIILYFYNRLFQLYNQLWPVAFICICSA